MEVGSRARWGAGLVVILGLTGAVGCEPAGSDAPVAEERTVPGPATRTYDLPPRIAALDANPAPATNVQAAPNVSVDARVLVVSASGASSALDAIQQILGFLGTPHDVFNASSGTPLTPDALATGDHGNYQAIFLDLDDLSVSGASAFSDDEWMVLAEYEAKFGVRRVALYGTGSSAYGLARAGGGFDAGAAPVTAHCTDEGIEAFVGANCAAPVMIDSGWVYPAAATDAQTEPLLVDDAGHIYAAVRTYPDGRQALSLTFSQAPTAIHTLELGYGLVNWATRGVFLGERHVFLSPQLDDLFLASQIYPRTGETYRITDGDLQSLANWQAARRAADPRLANLRIAFAANGFGARNGAQDPLVAKAMALVPTFAFINHTWDHVYMDMMDYATALDEFTHNDQALRALGLTPYSSENAVTPGVTGLGNAAAMQAAYDAGIRYVVSDSSYPGQKNPSPNAPIPNALVPSVLELPRVPTELGYDNAMPAEFVAEYNVRNTKAYSYDQIIAAESLSLVRFLLIGNIDPFMFHQANAKDIGGGRSLLGDLLGATLDRYLAVATFPVQSPTMDELGDRFANRMAYDASGVSATIEAGARLTVKVANAARIPITGVCTPNAESYAGQTISYVDLPAGGSASFDLTSCNPGSGPTGPGAVGATGRGNATGAAMGSGSSSSKSSWTSCAVAGSGDSTSATLGLAAFALALALALTRRRPARRQ